MNDSFAAFSTTTYANALFWGDDNSGYDLAFRTSGDDDAAQAVPEPGALALLGLGLVGLFGASRKKRA